MSHTSLDAAHFPGNRGLMRLFLVTVVCLVWFVPASLSSGDCSVTATPYTAREVIITVRCKPDVDNGTIPEILKNASVSTPRIYMLIIAQNQLSQILPETFDYTPGLQALDLSNNLLSSVPSSAFSRKLSALKILDLSRNLITALEDDAFPLLSNLESLRLTRNRISTISRGAFHGLSRLVRLRLENNLIETIADGVFDDMPKLEEISLSDNLLGVISGKIFTSASLTSLTLTRNQIVTLAYDAFNQLRRLEELDLSENVIGDVHGMAFRNLHTLTTLQLSNNHIQNLSTGVFKDLRQLKQLSLSENSIDELSSGVLSPLPALVQLDLAGNPLTSLDKGALKDVGSLQRLSMRATGIKYLPDMSGLDHLHRLELDESDIEKVYGCDLARMPALKWISLQDAPLGCDCDLQWLLNWYLVEAAPAFMGLVNRSTVCSQSSIEPLRGRGLLTLDVDDLCDGENETFCRADDKPKGRPTHILVPVSWPYMDTLTVDNTHLSSITVKWFYRDRDQPDEKVVLFYHSVGGDEPEGVDVEPSAQGYTLSNLQFNTEYNICMSDAASPDARPDKCLINACLEAAQRSYSLYYSIASYHV